MKRLFTYVLVVFGLTALVLPMKAQNIPVEDFQMVEDTLYTYWGHALWLPETKFTPENATNKKVNYHFSQEDVANFDYYAADGTPLTMRIKEDAVPFMLYGVTEDGGFTDSCYIALTLRELKAVFEEITLHVGDSKPLQLEYTPKLAHNKRCTYEIADASICTIDADGMITALQEGSTDVTATSVDGGHQVTVKVTVVADDVYIPTVETLDEEYVRYCKGWSDCNNLADLHYADVNGDGVKERFALIQTLEESANGYVYRFSITWINMQGEHLSQYTVDLGYGEDYQMTNYLLHDFNNDNIPDFLYFDGFGSPYDKDNGSGSVVGDYRPYIFKIAYSTPSGYVLQDAGLRLPQGPNIKKDLMVCGDFNRDGRDDILSYEWYSTGVHQNLYTPYLYLQTADGTFVRTPFPETTDEAEINNALYSSGLSGSFTYNVPFTFSPASLRKAPPRRDALTATEQTAASTTPSAAGWQVLDLNQDGYLDIISADGMSFLSLPNGKWYQAAIAGTVGMCDFNADGVKDLVIFDAATGQVDLLLSSADGLVKSSLYNNANITHVICEDMDADGKSDILLLATTNTHQYMLFFKNQGDGTFKRNERALAGNYEYKGIYHFNANGFPTLVFYTESYKRVDWDSSFTLTETQLVPFTEYFVHDNYWINDYYGDGNLYISVAYGSVVTDSWGTSFNIKSQNHIYLLSESQTAPQAVGKPNVIVDKGTGVVKVSWTEATDTETSQADLDYEVRVQDAMGTKAYLLARTAGNNSIIFDPTVWPQGDYIVQVRTIDKTNLVSAWSEQVSFTNEVVAVHFTLSEETLYLSDTLVVRSLSGETLSLQALPDGEILSNENGVARIIFHDLGDKTIIASTNGVASQQALYVEPFRTPSHGNAAWGFGGLVFDFNQDGKLEGWSNYWKEPGFYTLDKGVPTIYPSLNLSDTEWQYGWVTDNNHDGLPDFIGQMKKNGVYYTVGLNQGDLDFEFQEGFTREEDGVTVVFNYNSSNNCEYLFDLNNDGLVDFYGARYTDQNYNTTSALYQNLGNNVVKRVSDEGIYVVASADFNKDGYVDLIVQDAGYWIYLNKGDFTFDKIQLAANIYPREAYDINYDGYPDLILMENSVYYALLGSADCTFTQRVDLPGQPLPYDLDNDGRYDYIQRIDDYDYIYLDRVDGAVLVDSKDADIASYGDYNLPARFDIDEDGYPDALGENLTIKTRFTNTAPTAPTAVYVSQTDNEIIVNWEGANDKESHHTMLRYNLSVREKGTEYYVISPLNANNNEARTIHPGYDHYRAATCYPIPATAFELGKTYEICVQTIDPWFAHSDFSEVIEFTASKMLINLPAKGGVGLPVPFSTNGGASATVIAEDGVVSGNTITWNTPGNKTVTVFVGEEMATQTILIVEKPEIELALPATILEGDKVTIDLPAVLAQPEYNYSLTCNDRNTRIELLDGAKAIIHASDKIEDGYYAEVTFTLKYQDPVFGAGVAEQNVQIYSNVTPSIKMVTVENDGVRVQWDMATLYAAYTGDVNIYRETTIADQYELIATVPFADGSYLDETAVADVRSYRYVIALPTAYGTEGEQSAHHTTIHTMINQGMGNNVNLHWTHYEGAPVAQYTILSGTSPDNLSVLDNVSGNAQSYTHRRSSEEDTYYALAYTLKSAMAAPSIVHRAPAAALEGRSNIICSNEAYNVTPVESIEISARESTMMLTNNQPQLHLLATVEPIRATLARVAWNVTAGEDYAAISSDGVLSITATEDHSGMITVQAKAVDGSEVTATANIPMNYTAPAETVAVTGVLMSHTSCTINVGETLQLTATIEPANATNKNVTWTSNNTNVATIENGLITAVAEGTAVVSVTTEDGGFQAGCFVTVINGTALEDVNADATIGARKVLENGVIYILRNGDKYTLDGRKVEHK